MAIDNADYSRDAECDQVTDENAKIRQQLAERDAELARLRKALAEQKAEHAKLMQQLQERMAAQARLDMRITTLEMRAQRIVARNEESPATSPAAKEALPRAEEARDEGTPGRHRQRPSVDVILRLMPSPEALYLLMLIGFLFESVLNLFGERTQWILLKFGGITAGLITVAAGTVAWRRKNGPNAE